MPEESFFVVRLSALRNKKYNICCFMTLRFMCSSFVTTHQSRIEDRNGQKTWLVITSFTFILATVVPSTRDNDHNRQPQRLTGGLTDEVTEGVTEIVTDAATRCQIWWSRVDRYSKNQSEEHCEPKERNSSAKRNAFEINWYWNKTLGFYLSLISRLSQTFWPRMRSFAPVLWVHT